MNIWQDSNNQPKTSPCSGHAVESEKWEIQHNKLDSNKIIVHESNGRELWFDKNEMQKFLEFNFKLEGIERNTKGD